MQNLLRAAAVVATAAIGAGAIGAGFGEGHPRSTDALAVRDAGEWVTWWRREAAPTHWDGDAPLGRRVEWRRGAEGLEWGELQLRGASEAWRTRMVVVRLDPRQIALSLDPAFAADRDWTAGSADSRADIAFDAGQFRGSLPWGWVMTGGKEILQPQYAPLAGAVVVDSSGRVRVVPPDSVAAERGRGTTREAFQSYPMLLESGAVPVPLIDTGRGVDLAHRDARLALGTMADGRVVIALTRFDALGGALGRIPFGLTSPEMAAVMGALGCREALLLDGGISGQLLVRDSGGTRRVWPGTRSVPLGLIGRARR